MVESMMYAGIGFLAASLLAVGIVPLLHARTERLTIQRLEASLPLSLSEVQAERDALRADFAVTVRQLEVRIECLTSICARQMADLGRKADLINRLQIENGLQKVEIIARKGVSPPRVKQSQQAAPPRRRLFGLITQPAKKSAA